MIISTQHMLPPTLPNPLAPQDAPPVVPATGLQTPNVNEPQPEVAEDAPKGALQGAFSVERRYDQNMTISFLNTATSTEDMDGAPPDELKAEQSLHKPSVNGDGTVDAPMEIVDVDEAEAESKPVIAVATAEQGQAPAQQPTPQQPTYPGGHAIDVCFEASKLPLDVAIFNSARAAGGDEKIRKYLQAVLVIGGSALIPGMAHALESRYGDCIALRVFVFSVH